MTELMRQLQAAILLAADTVSMWRDGAVAVLAGLVILLLTIAYAGQPDA